MKILRFDTCLNCPYFKSEATIRVEGEVLARRTFRCGFSGDREILKDLKFEEAMILIEVIPDWCQLPNEEINGIPQ